MTSYGAVANRSQHDCEIARPWWQVTTRMRSSNFSERFVFGPKIFTGKENKKGFESTASGVSWEVVSEGQGKPFFRFLGQNGELNYLELCRVEYTTNLPVPYIFGSCCSQLPIYKGTIDPWFQIYRELEDEGIHLNFKLMNVEDPPIVTKKTLAFNGRKGWEDQKFQREEFVVFSSSDFGKYHPSIMGNLRMAPENRDFIRTY